MRKQTADKLVTVAYACAEWDSYTHVLHVNCVKELEEEIEQLQAQNAMMQASRSEKIEQQAKQIEELQSELSAIHQEKETNQKWAFLEWRGRAKDLQEQIKVLEATPIPIAVLDQIVRQEEQIAELSKLKRPDMVLVPCDVIQSAKNLMAVKGRHHTELAYKQLCQSLINADETK